MRNYDFPYLNQTPEVSADFAKEENAFFVADRVSEFDPDSAAGTLEWVRHVLRQRMSFNQVTPLLEQATWSPKGASFEDDKYAEEFPAGEYEKDVSLPFSLSFVSPRTVRLRLSTSTALPAEEQSLMLDGVPSSDASWKRDTDTNIDGSVINYASDAGTVTIAKEPWHVEFRDPSGRLLTRTQNFSDTKCLINSDPTPFCFVRRASDLRRKIAASFTLSSDEKLFGCGESFTRLNKRGQKISLWMIDAHSAQTPDMYKPIPFFLSDRGYGMFVHTTAPLTFDFGASYDGANTIYMADEHLDLFVFFGTPKEILSEYTALTGRSPVPPLWSFGLWMSRITYDSEEQAREVARKMREHRVPCDVIHLDTGWFEEDWRCNYEFSTSRFEDPAKMISDLKNDGFRISLWQLPYFTPKNELYQELVEAGCAIVDADGKLPTEDAIIDFSKPEAVRWYQGKLADLLEMGVGAIKVDFGEAAPRHGAFASGKSGLYEHNLYPLRYNKAAAEITQEVTGESVIWARSAWAGSQRYPLHWGGDAENTDSAMAATLRAGLSLGLCGFSFWSHDIGGFVESSPRDLYRRWMPFGMLTSHSRCHGAPPKEPWEYDEAFTDDFRRAVELKYRLMPYIYAQANLCSQQGLPMIRTLFFEYPEDRTCWTIEDEYMLGDSILVAPLLEEDTARDVYLPPGVWIDYQSGQAYRGSGWHVIHVEDVPAIVLVQDGAAIPHARLAQSTTQLNWETIELVLYVSETSIAEGALCLPEDNVVHTLRLEPEAGNFMLTEDPLPGRVEWDVSRFAVRAAPQSEDG